MRVRLGAMSDFIDAQVRAYDERLAEIDRMLAGYEDLVVERERLVAARQALAGDAPSGAEQADRPPQ